MFAFGVIVLELITAKKPKGLYDAEWPGILDRVDPSLQKCLNATLATNPKERLTFTNLRQLLEEEKETITALPCEERKQKGPFGPDEDEDKEKAKDKKKEKRKSKQIWKAIKL